MITPTRIAAAFVLSASLAACEATMPPPPPAQPTPAPSGKAQLDDADIERTLAPLRQAIDACIDQYKAEGRPEAIVVIAPSGSVKSADIYQIYNVSERRCLERDLRAARFPAFTGAEMRVVVSLAHPATDGGVDGATRD